MNFTPELKADIMRIKRTICKSVSDISTNIVGIEERKKVMSELSVLAEFITKLKLQVVPERVKEAAVLHTLDTVGTAVGASKEGQIQRVTEMWKKKEGTGGPCHIWGSKETVGIGTGTFLNAMMGHTQELDDVHTNSKTHIGTVVIPAAWCMAEYLGASGEAFLEAVICGYEVMSRIGMGFGVSAHRNAGWHVTATAGTFGAAAAAGKLLGLDQQHMIYALGLAGAQSFGTWAFLGDGATCKALNPARAAQSGVEAALLAQAGMTGPEHILTAEDGGLFSLMTAAPELEKVTAGLGETWQILEVDNKPYPSCRSTHCTVDAALEICKDHAIDPEQIEHITVDTYLVGYKQCGLSEGSVDPRTVVNAKFSTPFTVACAVLYGKVTLEQMDVKVITDPRVQELIKKTQVRAAEEFTAAYPDHWGCRIQMQMKDGTCYSSIVRDASGSVDQPLTRQQVCDKAVSLMAPVCNAASDADAEMVLTMDGRNKLPVLFREEERSA